MPGLDPGIHAYAQSSGFGSGCVDGQIKSGHGGALVAEPV
jgi:hypothetical protein